MIAESNGLLTPDEMEAMRLSAELANMIARVVTWGPTRDADLAEIFVHLHAVQHAVLAQAAARAYPNDFRLLGEILF